MHAFNLQRQEASGKEGWELWGNIRLRARERLSAPGPETSHQASASDLICLFFNNIFICSKASPKP